MLQKDREVLRRLADEYRTAGDDSRNAKNRKDWKALNALKPVRPMMLMDQLPWHELNNTGELNLECTDPFLREVEYDMRKILYKWRHFPSDMVVLPYVEVAKVIHSTSIGVEVHEKIEEFDKGNEIVSHEYIDQLSEEEDLLKLKKPIISLDVEETNRRQSITEEIFDGILPVHMTGYTPLFSVWDDMSMYRGVTELFYDMLDRPEFIHDTVRRLTDIQKSALLQYEALGLLEGKQHSIHCTGAFTDELPQELPEGTPVRAKDVWAFGLAQMFSSCSKEMHKEFEMEYAKEYYSMVGLGYYGCCEPLHDRIDCIREIPNIRKISISPWADVNIGAENIGKDFVLSRKPTPAYIATPQADFAAVKREIQETLDACDRNGTPCELILKDVSTVYREPHRLVQWHDLVRGMIDSYGI